MENFGFRKLTAYTKAKELTKRTYLLLKQFPREEQFALCDQLRRAAVSVTSNIAEGTTRYSLKEKVHFLEMAYTSLMECASQMEIACEIGYIKPEEQAAYDQLIVDCARLITGLQNNYKERLNSAQNTQQSSL